MSHRLFAAAALGAAGLLLAGCATSPPMQFYLLNAVDTSSAALPAAAETPGIRINRVTIPGEIDRPEITQRITPNQLQIHEQDRWAGPLDEMIRRVLAEDLARSAAAVDATTAQPQVINLDIAQFFADGNCAVDLRADWSATASASAPARRGAVHVHIGGQSTCPANAVPTALSAALAQLAEQLRQDVAKATSEAGGPG